MAGYDDRDRVGQLGGSNTAAGTAANHKATRNLRIEQALEKADPSSAPPPPAATSQSANGVDFFKGRPATAAQKTAKQAALLKKLRERDRAGDEMDD